MKLLAKIAVVVTFISTVAYLFGCFIETSFDASTWNSETRITIASISAALSVLASLGTAISHDNEKLSQ